MGDKGCGELLPFDLSENSKIQRSSLPASVSYNPFEKLKRLWESTLSENRR